MILPPYSLEPALRVLVEAFAAEVALRLALLGERAADRGPGRDPAVVVARLKERVEAAHPVVADERVLERELEAVADRQRAGDVRRGMHDDECLAGRARVGLVKAFLLPGLLPAGLDGLLVVHRLHGEDLRSGAVVAGMLDVQEILAGVDPLVVVGPHGVVQALAAPRTVSGRRRSPACRADSRPPSAGPSSRATAVTRPSDHGVGDGDVVAARAQLLDRLLAEPGLDG